MVDNFTARTYDKGIISAIHNYVLKSQSSLFKIKSPNCYLLSNGMNGGNESYMSIEIRQGHYSDCRINGSIRKWYHGALSDKDLRKEEFLEAINLLEKRIGLPQKGVYTFVISRIEVGLNAKTKYDSTYVKSQIIGFKRSSYKIGDFEGYRRFSTKYKDKTAKIYDKKNEIRKNIGLIKDIDEMQFIKQSQKLNILRVEFVVARGKANVKREIGIENIGDIVRHYPKLLVFFLRQIKLFQFKDSSDIEFKPIKGNVSEFTNHLLKVAVNKLGAVGVRDIISQLAPNHQSDARRKLKKLLDDTKSTNCIKIDVIRAFKKQGFDLFRNKEIANTNTYIKN